MIKNKARLENIAKFKNDLFGEIGDCSLRQKYRSLRRILKLG
jgi:hypothetical protein